MILLFAFLLWLIVLVVVWRWARHAVRDVLAIGIQGIATAGFFWRILFGDAWMPAGGGDLANFLYPTYKFAAESWRRGVVPLWNPYLFAGQPFLGDIQSSLFYPINLLTFFLSVPLAFRDMELLSILHFWIAGVGMYLFLRFGKWKLDVRNWKLDAASTNPTSNFQSPTSNAQSPISNPPISQSLNLSRLACLAGAIAFQFSDLFITHFGNLNLIATAAWLPLVLLFYRRAIMDGRISFSVIAGIWLGIAFHAGHIQSFLFILIALGLLAIGMMIENRIRWGDLQHYIGGLFIVALVSFGIAAPVLIPALEFTQNTVRAEFTYKQAAEFSLPPAQLIGLFVPGFFGRGPLAAWGPWQRVEVGYLGILPLLLALLAIILRRDSATKFFAIFSLIGLALALGGYAILHGWLYQFVPGFGQLRAPARFVFLLDFGLAVLAALGFDALLRALPSTTLRSAQDEAPLRAFKAFVRVAPWVFLIVAVASGAMIYAMLILGQGQDAVLFQRLANAANSIAFFILLLALSLGLVLARATRWFRPTAWATAALALIFFDLFSLGAYVDISSDNPSKVFEHSDAVAFLQSDENFFRIDPRGTEVDKAWTADTGIVYNLSSIDGDNPLILSEFDKYWNGMGSRSSALYDLLNAKYLIGRKNVPVDRAKFKLAFDGDPGLSIFENTHVLPRAFIASEARVVPNHSAAWDAIHAADFDPARTVVLEGGVPTPTASGHGDAAVRIASYGPNAIALETSAASAGVLVLSEVWYPGWRGFVDDREVEVLRADYLYRAVELPGGAHRVRFQYDPGSFKLGLGLFGVTVASLVGFWIFKRRG